MPGKLRVFILTQDGVEAKELTTAFEGVRKTFKFPYATRDDAEAEYLISKGATVRGPAPRPFGRTP